MVKKILLVAPMPFDERRHREDPPLGLAYLASSLEKEGHQVKIFDMGVEEMDLFEEIKAFSPEIIGIQIMTQHRFFAFDLAKEIKRRFSHIKIIIGGVHPTFTGKEILEKIPHIDFAIKGEGEKSFIELINGKNLKEISGLIYRERRSGLVLENSIKEWCDLNKLSYPVYSLLNLSQYKLKVKGKRAMSIFTSRGCPNKCVFCAASQMWPFARFRNPSNVLNEIKILKEKYHYKALVIEDDTFGLHKNFALEILRGIKSLDMIFAIKTRVDVLDREFIEQLKKSGCVQISFGIESGDQRILKAINKNIDLSKVKEVVYWCEKLKLDARAYFMIGNLGEDKESATKTLHFARQLFLKGINISWSFGVIIFPGTELERIAKEKGYLPSSFSWTESYFEPRNKLLGHSPLVPILETPKFKIENIIEYKNEWFSGKKRIGAYLSGLVPKKIKRIQLLKKIYRGFLN